MFPGCLFCRIYVPIFAIDYTINNMKLSMTQYERVQRLSTNTAVVRSKINHQTFVAHTITIDQSEMWSIEK